MCHSSSWSLVEPSTRKRRVMTSKTITIMSAIATHAVTLPIQTIQDSVISSSRSKNFMPIQVLASEKIQTRDALRHPWFLEKVTNQVRILVLQVAEFSPNGILISKCLQMIPNSLEIRIGCTFLCNHFKPSGFKLIQNFLWPAMDVHTLFL